MATESEERRDLPVPADEPVADEPQSQQPEQSRPARRGVPPPRDPAAGGYICDAMLGRLARELRMRGIDAYYQRNLGGMMAFRQARASGRTLLTRNKRLAGLPGVVIVESARTPEQVAQITGAPVEAKPVVAEPEPEPPLGRCLDCNTPLEAISRDAARPAIPFFIYQIHHDFRRCPKCKKVFWPGSHVQDMKQRAATRSSQGGRGRR